MTTKTPRGSCILCNKAKGNPNFCDKCRKKDWKLKFKAIKKRGRFYGGLSPGGRVGRPKYGSRIMQEKFSEEAYNEYNQQKQENDEI